MFYKNLKNNSMNFKNYKVPSFDMEISNLDENSRPFGSVSNVYNFDVSTGALTDGIGVSNLKFLKSGSLIPEYKNVTLPTDIFPMEIYFVNCWIATQKSFKALVIFQLTNGAFCYNQLNSNDDTACGTIDNLHLTDTPILINTKINGTDNLLFYSYSDGLFIWDLTSNSATKVSNTTSITSSCIHEGRMFLTSGLNKKVVMFSEALNPINYNVSTDEVGYINFGDSYGSCNKVISFNDELFVIRDYNIAKIVSYNDKKVYKVKQLNCGNSLIYANTITICDDFVIYLASDGLYEFNGNTVNKIVLDIDNIIDIDNRNAVGEYLNGYYYFACRANFKDRESLGVESDSTFKNNLLIKLNIKTKKYSILRGYDVRQLVAVKDGVNNQMMIRYYTETYESKIGLLDMSGLDKLTATQKGFRSTISDLGYPEKKKFIKHIDIKTTTEIKLKLNLDNKTFLYLVHGKEKSQRIKINKKAKTIGFEIIAETNNTYISRPTFCIGIL